MPNAQDLWEMPVIKQTELDYITAQEFPKAPARRRAFLPDLACCVVLLFFGWFWQYRMAETTVFLDVNPSIQITANQQDQVLGVTGLNADGRSLIEGREFSSLPFPLCWGSWRIPSPKPAKVYIQKTTVEGDPIGHTLTYQDGVYTLLVDSRADQFAAEEDRKVAEYTYSNLVTFPSPGEVDGDLTFTEWWLTDNPELTAETAWEEESPGFLLLATRSNG